MKENKISTASLIITSIGIIVIIGIIYWGRHYMGRFVPTPPPTSQSATISPLSDIPSPGTTDTATSSATQPASVCYAVNDTTGTASLELTTTDGESATGELAVTAPQSEVLSGVLAGTLTAGSDNASITFNGQLTDSAGTNAPTSEIITLNQNQAQVGSLTLSRVACSE